jgi:hypothetical protein
VLTPFPRHNGRVFGRVGFSGSLAALVTVAALLAGCSDDDKGPDVGASTSGSPSGATSASESASDSAGPTLPVPEGVELSPEGSQLGVGDTATVAYELRQGVVGVLDIKVTRLEKTSFKKSFVGWDLDQGQKNSNPYFVRATVTNRGDTDLGGKRVPLYIVDGTNTLVEATTFASAFPPCEPGSFPTKFKTGSTLKVCLVFLSPKKGELTAVSFRPTQAFDPITWTGELEKPKPPKPDKPGKGGKGDGKGDQDGDQPTGSAG